jgi:hypothetical protein
MRAGVSATIVHRHHVVAYLNGDEIGDMMALAVRGTDKWLGIVKREKLQVQCGVCGHKWHEFRGGGRSDEPQAFFVCLDTTTVGKYASAQVKPICATCAEQDDDEIIRRVLEPWGGSALWERSPRGRALH